MRRIQIRPLTGAVNLPLNIAAPGLREETQHTEQGGQKRRYGWVRRGENAGKMSADAGRVCGEEENQFEICKVEEKWKIGESV